MTDEHVEPAGDTVFSLLVGLGVPGSLAGAAEERILEVARAQAARDAARHPFVPDFGIQYAEQARDAARQPADGWREAALAGQVCTMNCDACRATAGE